MTLSTLHPASLILAWFGFAATLSWFRWPVLMIASIAIAVLILLSGVPQCWRLIRRSRVLLLVLLLVYAFSTPGTALIPGWEQANPTQAGLAAGAFQAWRLLLMVSALAVLLAVLTRQQLLSGIYTMLQPFKPLGVPVERFSVRLWLTLHYLETAPKITSLKAYWESALRLPENPPAKIELELPLFGRSDLVFALMCTIVLGAALWLG